MNEFDRVTQFLAEVLELGGIEIQPPSGRLLTLEILSLRASGAKTARVLLFERNARSLGEKLGGFIADVPEGGTVEVPGLVAFKLVSIHGKHPKKAKVLTQTPRYNGIRRIPPAQSR